MTVATDSIIQEWDKSFHTLVMGPAGCGKTNRILKPMMQQLLEAYQKGEKLGVTIIDPKGDMAEDIVDWCKEYQIPYTYIDFGSPDSSRFNPLQGDSREVAQAITAGFKSLLRNQDTFFVETQLNAVKDVIWLLKELHGDNVNLQDAVEMLRDKSLFEKKVEELEKLKGETDFVKHLKSHVLVLDWDKYQRFTLGVCRYIEDMLEIKNVKEILSSDSDINLDRHLKEGGVMIVNSGSWKLREYGNVLGISLMMHLQNAVLRRTGNHSELIPHYLFVDEFAFYATPDIESLIASGRAYKCSCIFSFQSFFHLGKYFTESLLNNCRNRFIFSGISSMDKDYLEPIASHLSADKSLVYWGKEKVVTYANK